MDSVESKVNAVHALQVFHVTLGLSRQSREPYSPEASLPQAQGFEAQMRVAA